MNKLLTAVLCTFLGAAAFAGGSGNFSLGLKTDSVLLGAGTLVNLGALYSTRAAEAPASPPAGLTAWPSFRYDGTQDDVSTLLSVAGVAAFPLLLDDFTVDDIATLGTMYAETFLLTWGTKDLLKGLLPKFRPYTAYGDTPAELLEERDRFFSFPSGHTAVAFATAAFSTSVFSSSQAKRSTKVLFGAGAYGLAATVAVLRVTSGSHYLSDVAGGALIGTLYGILVPALHRNGDFSPAAEDGPSLAFDGRSVEVKVSFR